MRPFQNRRPTRKSALAKLVVQTADAAANPVFAHARFASAIAAPQVLNPTVLAVALIRLQLRQTRPMKIVAAKVVAKSSPQLGKSSNFYWTLRFERFRT